MRTLVEIMFDLFPLAVLVAVTMWGLVALLRAMAPGLPMTSESSTEETAIAEGADDAVGGTSGHRVAMRDPAMLRSRLSRRSKRKPGHLPGPHRAAGHATRESAGTSK